MAFSIYTVTEQEASLSVRDFLKIHHVSARQVQKLTRSKGILLNGRPAFLKATLRAGDIVKIKQTVPQESSIQAEDLPIEVLYEDDYLIALNKPPRQLVHPAGHTTSGTLSNALAYYLKHSGKPVCFHPIHRLDRDTSGCVLFAKSADVQRELEKQRDTHTLTRTYRALVS
ncbi:MAG: RluA family pseudouridine synthase, partial [Selenomonadales bacterium]|nr:RluA family pseudouridine synthase [Selenomonadales bacterium]